MLCETEILYADTGRFNRNVPPFKETNDRKWNSLWRIWIENYSEREFSFPDDRLPGIVGLMQAYQRETSDEPCLGLWRRSLSEDLAWCRVGTLNDRPAHPALSQSLPSWSPFACRTVLNNNLRIQMHTSDAVSVREKFACRRKGSSLCSTFGFMPSRLLLISIKGAFPVVTVNKPVIAQNRVARL